jgi:hypothetical protein
LPPERSPLYLQKHITGNHPTPFHTATSNFSKIPSNTPTPLIIIITTTYTKTTTTKMLSFRKITKLKSPIFS